ncbi:MAG: hypothetical protein ACOYN3_07485 [Acidimicrobiia bacterium]
MSNWAYVAIGWIGTAVVLGAYTIWCVAHRRRVRRALRQGSA